MPRILLDGPARGHRIIENSDDNFLRNIEMKNIKLTLVALTLLGALCLASGCDRFGDAATEGLFGLVSDVTADWVSNILGINVP